MEVSESTSQRGRREREEVKVKRKTLKAVLEQCQRALESLSNPDDDDGDDDDDDDGDHDYENPNDSNRKEVEDEGNCAGSSTSSCPESDFETEQLCVLLKSRVEGPEFIEKLESAQISVQQTVLEESSSWDLVSDSDLWEGGNVDVDQEDYIVVREEDIVDGIASFMAAYLLSLKQTKDLTPNQLQEALSKTFSVKKRKGKLRKALDGSKVIYNVASWSATAIGIYQNPALLRAASTAFWTSCRVISRLF